MNVEALENLLNYSRSNGNAHILETIDVIRSILKNINYDISKICISFNGGKDCTALLYILYLLIFEGLDMNQSKNKLLALFISHTDDFDEVLQFISETKCRYSLNMFTIAHTDFKIALTQFKSSKEGSRILYVFMGSRRTDPSAQSTFVQSTDNDWPEFKRVSPILNWTYRNVWKFLLDMCLPYCALYDKGYASIGTKQNTKVTPSLIKADGSGFIPAWMLEDEIDERQARKS